MILTKPKKYKGFEIFTYRLRSSYSGTFQTKSTEQKNQMFCFVEPKSQILSRSQWPE